MSDIQTKPLVLNFESCGIPMKKCACCGELVPKINYSSKRARKCNQCKEEETRRCRTCKQIKPGSEFSSSKSYKCNDCKQHKTCNICKVDKLISEFSSCNARNCNVCKEKKYICKKCKYKLPKSMFPDTSRTCIICLTKHCKLCGIQLPFHCGKRLTCTDCSHKKLCKVCNRILDKCEFNRYMKDCKNCEAKRVKRKKPKRKSKCKTCGTLLKPGDTKGKCARCNMSRKCKTCKEILDKSKFISKDCMNCYECQKKLRDLTRRKDDISDAVKIEKEYNRMLNEASLELSKLPQQMSRRYIQDTIKIINPEHGDSCKQLISLVQSQRSVTLSENIAFEYLSLFNTNTIYYLLKEMRLKLNAEVAYIADFPDKNIFGEYRCLHEISGQYILVDLINPGEILIQKTYNTTDLIYIVYRMPKKYHVELARFPPDPEKLNCRYVEYDEIYKWPDGIIY